MGWAKQLGKDQRGSRPRCVLLVDGGGEEVAARLTRLVGVDGVTISGDDVWMPGGKPVQREDGSWDATVAEEVELDKPNDLLPLGIRERLGNWWLAVSENDPRTPNWDIASTCTVGGRKGLLLVEAKAHWNEVARGPQVGETAGEACFRRHAEESREDWRGYRGGCRWAQNGDRRRVAYFTGQSLPAFEPVCVVVEAGLAGGAGCSGLSGIPLCHGYRQGGESFSLRGALGAGHQGP